MARTLNDGDPQITLARDEFSQQRRALVNHPEAVASSTHIDVEDMYGNLVTWVLDLFRLDGDVTALVQRGAYDGSYVRMVIPPAVTRAIARHQAGLVTKARRKVARRVVADRKARGEQVGNPEALAKARRDKATMVQSPLAKLREMAKSPKARAK